MAAHISNVLSANMAKGTCSTEPFYALRTRKGYFGIPMTIHSNAFGGLRLYGYEWTRVDIIKLPPCLLLNQLPAEGLRIEWAMEPELPSCPLKWSLQGSAEGHWWDPVGQSALLLPTLQIPRALNLQSYRASVHDRGRGVNGIWVPSSLILLHS